MRLTLERRYFDAGPAGACSDCKWSESNQTRLHCIAMPDSGFSSVNCNFLQASQCNDNVFLFALVKKDIF